MTNVRQRPPSAEEVQADLWRHFLVREQGEQLGRQQGARLREQEALCPDATSPQLISEEQQIKDAWFEAVARAHVEAATEVRARHMPWPDEFADAYVHGFLRAYRGARSVGELSGEGSSPGDEATKP